MNKKTHTNQLIDDKNHNKNPDKNHELSNIFINSRHFKSKINLTEILGILESTDDMAIYVDEKILPEINEDELDFTEYLEIIDAISYLASYGKMSKIKQSELKSFILILIDLLYNNYNLNGNIVLLKINEIKTKNKAIEFLSTLTPTEMDEKLKLKLLVNFVLNNYEKEKELIKKSVILTPEHIEKINQVEGKGFSAKVRYILDSYFTGNKSTPTEEELTLGVSNDLIEIFSKLKKEILSWDKNIKFKPIKHSLIFSYYYRFLKVSFDKDKINLELSFSSDKPFEDYKSITKEIKPIKTANNQQINNKTKTNNIRRIEFSLNSFKDINYALLLIKQSYENNNEDIYSYAVYNHSIHKLFNDTKRHTYPFPEKIQKNGLFVLFEKGEKFQDEDRIVYVGSNNKENRIPKMLKYIFKDGNRDNTSFRKNIGKSLLEKEDSKYIKKFKVHPTAKIKKLWDMDIKRFDEEYLEDSKENEEIENVEEMVSDYIQNNFSISIIEIDNKIKRLHLKSKIISSLSLADEFKPSDNWLGYDSPREKIRKSGLWLEQHIGNRENQLTEEDLEYLKKISKKYLKNS